ncbi:MAG TPA: hypothetical protein PKE16_08730, partial [Hyphomicrobium sp.]|nr:hypothetical protein [Hyphomicrobium sp.]
INSDIVTTPELPKLCLLLGAPDQWTTHETMPDRERRRFRLLGTVSEIIGLREENDHEIVTIEPKLDDEFDEPGTYGGGLWLAFISNDGKEDVDRRLIGVAYREIIEPGEPIRIECFGPKTIYIHLVQSVKTKFGENI